VPKQQICGRQCQTEFVKISTIHVQEIIITKPCINSVLHQAMWNLPNVPDSFVFHKNPTRIAGRHPCFMDEESEGQGLSGLCQGYW
jgi:hypothetical protein